MQEVRSFLPKKIEQRVNSDFTRFKSSIGTDEEARNFAFGRNASGGKETTPLGREFDRIG